MNIHPVCKHGKDPLFCEICETKLNAALDIDQEEEGLGNTALTNSPPFKTPPDQPIASSSTTTGHTSYGSFSPEEFGEAPKGNSVLNPDQKHNPDEHKHDGDRSTRTAGPAVMQPVAFDPRQMRRRRNRSLCSRLRGYFNGDHYTRPLMEAPDQSKPLPGYGAMNLNQRPPEDHKAAQEAGFLDFNAVELEVIIDNQHPAMAYFRRVFWNFRSEPTVGKLFDLAAVASVFISLINRYPLSAYDAIVDQTRHDPIGIDIAPGRNADPLPELGVINAHDLLPYIYTGIFARSGLAASHALQDMIDAGQDLYDQYMNNRVGGGAQRRSQTKRVMRIVLPLLGGLCAGLFGWSTQQIFAAFDRENEYGESLFDITAVGVAAGLGAFTFIDKGIRAAAGAAQFYQHADVKRYTRFCELAAIEVYKVDDSVIDELWYRCGFYNMNLAKCNSILLPGLLAHTHFKFHDSQAEQKEADLENPHQNQEVEVPISYTVARAIEDTLVDLASIWVGWNTHTVLDAQLEEFNEYHPDDVYPGGAVPVMAGISSALATRYYLNLALTHLNETVFRRGRPTSRTIARIAQVGVSAAMAASYVAPAYTHTQGASAYQQAALMTGATAITTGLSMDIINAATHITGSKRDIIAHYLQSVINDLWKYPIDEIQKWLETVYSKLPQDNPEPADDGRQASWLSRVCPDSFLNCLSGWGLPNWGWGNNGDAVNGGRERQERGLYRALD